jgi:hypothetical protein
VGEFARSTMPITAEIKQEHTLSTLMSDGVAELAKASIVHPREIDQ